MALDTWDWLLIAIFFIITIYVGIRYSSRAGQSLGEFFLSGRKLPWYVAGFSMVATTFAADTPLYVTEEVGNNGISGNWLWWNFLIGGMLTTFFFARLWRRANILTDLEFIELRYSGKPAAFLRGFKAVYFGLLLNAVVMAWVNLAFMTILEVFFGIPPEQLIWYVGGAMLFVAIYSSLSGLWGIAVNDFIQFSIAIAGSVILAILVVNSEQVGGITGLKEQLPASTLNFIPQIEFSEPTAYGSGGQLAIGFLTFLSFVGVQWWASWYPGAEPGGGGYVAQRMMSAKDEKNSLFATLFFQIAHYCIRSWPWIMVALAVIIIYPDLGAEEKRFGYVMAMRDFLPSGLRGLLLVTFLAAYMSTISTQLNWGTSYLVNDFYRRFFKKSSQSTGLATSQIKAAGDPESSENESGNEYIWASRIVTILMMLFALFITTQLDSIKQAWELILGGSAGMGLVLILRWYWWRINAWSEIVATAAPLLFFVSLYLVKLGLLHNLKLQYNGTIPEEAMPAFNTEHWYFAHPYIFFLTVGFTTVSWLVATYLSRPEPLPVLQTFFDRVRPLGYWLPVKKLAVQRATLRYNLLGWAGGILLAYCLLFSIGKFIFMEWDLAFLLLAGSVAGFVMMRFALKKTWN